MRYLLLIFTISCVSQIALGQIPDFNHNYNHKDSAGNPLIAFRAKNYESVIAYREESYWWSNRKHYKINYKIIAYANGKWDSWNYFEQSRVRAGKIRGTKVFSKKITDRRFQQTRSNIPDTAISQLFSKLNNENFWHLKNDSLNFIGPVKVVGEDGDTVWKKATLNDGINYRFDILTNHRAMVIESYEPGHFLEIFPHVAGRKEFINIRNYFLTWWEMYCQ